MASQTFLTKDIWLNINNYLKYDERFILSKVSKINNDVFWNFFKHPEVFEIETRNFTKIKDILSKWNNHNFKIDLSYDDNIDNIDFLKEYNNISVLDIRFCNLISNLSEFNNIKQIIVGGNIHPSLYNLPNIRVEIDSREEWKELNPQNTDLIRKISVIMHNPLFDRSKIPRGGWCNPVYTVNNTRDEKQLLFLTGLYYDKITSRITDISQELIKNNNFCEFPTYILKSTKFLMTLFNQQGPLHPIINCIFNLDLTKKEICKQLYQNVFFGIISSENLD